MSYFPLVVIFPTDYRIYFIALTFSFVFIKLIDKVVISSRSSISLIIFFYIVLYSMFVLSGGYYEKFVRLAPLALVYLLFISRVPFNEKSYVILKKVLTVIILYVFFTLIFIALGESIIINMRNVLYPISENVRGDPLFSLYEGFRSVRFAGIYYNPNVTGGLAFIILIGFYELFNPRIFSRYFYLLVIPSQLIIFLSGSRVYLVALIVFYLLRLYKTGDGFKWTVFLIIPILLIMVPALVSGFSEGGSMVIKLNYIYNHVSNSTIQEFVFGSLGQNVAFDAEYFYYLGNYGIIILLSVFYLYFYLIYYANFSKSFTVSLFVTGFANTVFYNLFYFSILFVIMFFIINRRKKPQLA